MDHDFVPDTREEIDHKVWTGLCGEEDRYAREHLPIFYVAMGWVRSTGNRIYINAGSPETACALLDTGDQSDIEIFEWRAIAAESFDAIVEEEKSPGRAHRYYWAHCQYNAAMNGWDVDREQLPEYETHAEAVKAEGPYGVLREKGILPGQDGSNGELSAEDGSAGASSSRGEDAEKYAVRTDLVIRAESKEEARQFVGNFLTEGVQLVDPPKIYDWTFGPSGGEKHQRPVPLDSGVFEDFTAGGKG